MNEMTRLYREGMAELRAENEQLKARIAELEEQLKIVWALVGKPVGKIGTVSTTYPPEVKNE